MEVNRNTNNQEFGLKWKPAIGFVICIILTAISLWAALYSGYSPKVLFMAISVIAFTQAVQQLLHVQPES